MTGLDGWTIVVETWDGVRYRHWSYWVPTDFQYPDARKAAYIARRVADFDTFVWAGIHERAARGIVTSEGDTLVFRECGGGRPWMLDMVQAPLRAAAGVTDSTPFFPLHTPLYMEARVLETPAVASRGWWNIPEKYAGMLQSWTVWKVRKAQRTDC